MALGVVGVVADERVIISAESVERVGPFFRRRRIEWHDVVSLTIRNDGDVILVSRGGVRIKIAADLVGIADLPDLLDRYLPTEVRQAFQADLERYRHFLGVRPRPPASAIGESARGASH